VAPHGGATRTAADFLAPGQAVVASDPRVHRWHVVIDNFYFPCAASLVRFVAAESKLALDLGEKGTHGMLAHRQSCAAFVHGPSPRLVFHETPQPTSWMNQINI
jgi:hypothetical protein